MDLLTVPELAQSLGVDTRQLRSIADGLRRNDRAFVSLCALVNRWRCTDREPNDDLSDPGPPVRTPEMVRDELAAAQQAEAEARRKRAALAKEAAGLIG